MSSVDKSFYFVFAVAVDSSKSGVVNAIPEKTTIVESKTDNRNATRTGRCPEVSP